jgi:hypothetical protein
MFTRWAEQSPEGPAIHSMLETPDGLIAGHCCLLPFRMEMGDRSVRVARVGYFFVSEDYRSQLVAGFEAEDKQPAAILLEQLCQCGSEQGWGPFLVSSAPETALLIPECQVVEFHMWECFFVLNPLKAWHRSKHLPPRRRRTLFLAGLAQQAFSFLLLRFTYDPRLVRNPRIGEALPSVNGYFDDGLSLPETEDFLSWRYPNDSYSRFVMSDGSPTYAIAQKASHSSYLRVCQSREPQHGSISSLVKELICQARWSHALGVRWSIYGGSEQDHLVAELRRLGFFCIPGVRRVPIYSPYPEYRSPQYWNLCDSLFTFDD